MIALWEAWNSDLQINVFELVQLQKSIFETIVYIGGTAQLCVPGSFQYDPQLRTENKYWNKNKKVKNPNWPDTKQLAAYLQGWMRSWNLFCREQIQLAVSLNLRPTLELLSDAAPPSINSVLLWLIVLFFRMKRNGLIFRSQQKRITLV